MMRNLSIILLFLLVSAYVNAEVWRVSESYTDSNKVYIELSDENGENFKSVLYSIDKSKTLNKMALGRLTYLDGGMFQQDILKFMNLNYPEKLKDALKSAGNLHNPKMIALRGPFEEAVLQSGFVRKINRELEKFGYLISGMEFEKFFQMKHSDNVTFEAFVWLKVEKSPNHKLQNIQAEKTPEVLN